MAGSFQTRKKLFFAMDFLNGGDFFTLLMKHAPLTERAAKHYMAEIILALEHLHYRGIVFRDLKPENIMLDFEGHIKITDYGLAKLGLKPFDNMKTFCGTPEYLAPEIIEGKKYTKSCDWWSLGCIFYEMIVGRHPFRRKNR